MTVFQNKNSIKAFLEKKNQGRQNEGKFGYRQKKLRNLILVSVAETETRFFVVHQFELSPAENMTPYEADILSKSTDDKSQIIPKAKIGPYTCAKYQDLAFTMRKKLPKLLDLLIFCIYSLNFSLEFFIMIDFVTNQLNISKFLPLQIRKTFISYQLKPNYTNLVNFFSQ